jgi:2-oxoglutarate dehydrogenase E2 component (dihydrolipoamide succinyltransferase)
MGGTSMVGRQGGRAGRADVDRRLARRTAPLVPEPPPTDLTTQGQQIGRPGVASSGADGEGVVPFSAIRARAAAHLSHSVATAVHALLVAEVDYGAVEGVRRDAGLTYLPFVARAVVDALRRYPDVNASVVDGGLLRHDHVNLGVAVDLAFEGLVVPVVHDADALRLRALADAVADRADRARGKHLQPHDVEGGTFTLTNVGSRTTVSSAPIINHPQVGILSMDGIRPRPIARPDGVGGYALVVRPIGHLSFSFDHRAFDGAYASAFLDAVRERIEDHDWAAELA